MPRLAILVIIAFGFACVAALMVPTVRLPSDDLGLRRFQTPELTRDIQLSQSFKMTADGFYAIEFRPVAAAPVISGVIHLAIIDATGHESRTVRTADITAADLIRSPAYTFQFEPIEHSRNTPYRLELTVSGGGGSGIVLWATKGERYSDGSLQINDVPRWADLTFKTSAPAGRSNWRTLMTVPPVGSTDSRGHIVVAALAIYWAALGFALWGFASRRLDKIAG